MKRFLAVAAIVLLAGCMTAPNPQNAVPTAPGVGDGDKLPSKAHWTMLHMVDETWGWAIRDGGIYRTSDGGRTWTNTGPPGPQFEGANDPSDTPAYFHNAEQAWVALSQNRQLTVYRTADGGQTWHGSQLDAEGRAQFHFGDDQYGWMLLHQGVALGSEQVEVYRTADGGETWTKAAHARPDSDSEQAGALPFGGIKKGVAFRDATLGWITAEDRGPGGVRLYKTTDGGVAWHKQVLPIPVGYESHSLTIYPPRFFSPADGLLPVTFVPGYETVSNATVDGGETWAPTSPVRASMTATSIIYTFVDACNGWTTDGEYLYATQDGGVNWTAYPVPASFRGVKQLQFLTAESGWAVTDDGLWVTNDGGRTWRPASDQTSISVPPAAVGRTTLTAVLGTPGPIGLEPFTGAVVLEAQAASGRPDYQLDVPLTNAWQVTGDLQLAAGHFENGAGLLIRLAADGRAELVGIGTHGAPGPASIEGVDGDLVLICPGTGHVKYNYRTGEVTREQRRSR